MRPKPLPRSGTIGLCSPSHIPLYEAKPGQAIPWSREYKNIIAAMEKEGFQVVQAENLYQTTWGYLASDRERGADLNQLAADPAVDYILFGEFGFDLDRPACKGRGDDTCVFHLTRRK